jgi:dTMP kinase
MVALGARPNQAIGVRPRVTVCQAPGLAGGQTAFRGLRRGVRSRNWAGGAKGRSADVVNKPGTFKHRFLIWTSTRNAFASQWRSRYHVAMKQDASGILIAFEGIDGAGKTTQVELATAFLERAGEPFVRSREPTDGPWGRKIKQSALNGRMSPADELHAFTEDRKDHVREVIAPALAAGKVVLLDRYFYSTVAYQSPDLRSMDGLLEQMLRIAPEPDIVLMLDTPAEIGLSRISDLRGDRPNAFETLANLKAVRNRFIKLVGMRQNLRLVDGTQNANTVHHDILHLLFDGILKAKRCAKPWGCDEPFACSYRAMGQCRYGDLRANTRMLS